MTATEAALLVVDDNEDNRYTLTRRLNREGYKNLTMASNGREALDKLKAQPFDLVLLDIMMPDMNGYEVLEQVKSTPALRDIPIIMISSLDEIESVIRCIELGAEDYLNKPFNPTLLRARVGASLEKKRLRDEVRRNMERLAQELDSARALQLAMLPRQFPTCSPSHPIAVHAVMEPAREVGGDLYDCFYAGEHTFCFLVGDVCGKGASAAMFMARARSLVRITVNLWQKWRTDDIDPGALLEAVNRELCQDNDDCMFVTMFLGVIDTHSGLVSFANAGHPPPHLVSTTGGSKQIDSKPALPLGLRPQTRFQTRTLEILPGDALFVYSDGVFEASNDKGDLFSIERLGQLLHEAHAAEPREMIRVIKDAVDAFTGCAPRSDDLTALALRWQPAEATAERPNMWGRRITHAVDVRIRNDVSDIGIARNSLDDLAREFGIPVNALTQLQVALDEVVSNVIKYSWDDGGQHEILVRITVQPDRVDLEIFDDGREFDPMTLPSASHASEGQRPRPGGRGIRMIKKLVDHFAYERIDGRNHTTLSKTCEVGTAIQESDK